MRSTKGQLDLAALGFSSAEQTWLRGLHWEFEAHLNAADGHTMVYRAAPLGMAMSTFSPKSRRAKPARWFTIRGDETQYDTLGAALRVARERGLVAAAMRESGFRPHAVPQQQPER